MYIMKVLLGFLDIIKNIFDRGALYYAISKNYYLFLILQFWLRRARNFNSALSEKEKVKTMLQGAMYLKRLK